MGRNVQRIKEDLKAQKWKWRHHWEDTNDKMEHLEEFFHEVRVVQKDYEASTEAQLKEQSQTSHELVK